MKLLTIVLPLLAAGAVCAEELPKDSLKVIDMEEVLVIATPKENRKVRELPVSTTLLSQEDMRANQVSSAKDLTSVIPNLFIPDYGSKLTTSIYIRGIGSRINTPAAGLYVDNIPYIDKSAFDFNYSDVERIDVLRGPQGTLYGRNTMAGLIKIHTKSPFSYQGTDLRLGAATYNNYRASLTHYHRISEQFAFSAGGFYEHTGGFFENVTRNNEKTDRSNSGGGRIRAIYLPTENLKLDLTLNYEYGDQGGYPYEYTGVTEGEEDRSEYIGQIANNERSGYRRGLFNTGLNLEYQARKFTLNAVTGYQNLNDRMFLDQDFTEQEIYTLEQRQRSNTLSEEIILKSKPGGNWQWTTGVSGFYQWLHTAAPVTFGKTGLNTVIEDNVNGIFTSLTSGNPRAPQMQMTINNQILTVGGTFDTPIMNGAVFHQSTFNNLLIEGLSATVGLRLDYEKLKMKYNSAADPMNFDFNISMSSVPRPLVSCEGLEANASFDGEESTDYLQLLPKFALQYEWKKGNSVYATVTKGYRSGGYNIQMFSDLVQGELKNSSLDALAADEQLSAYQQMILAQKDELPEVSETTRYKPEYSWSYELGSHLTLWEGRLWTDLAVYYMDTHDQQISQFAASGLGRTTVNAGKSRSYGTEISLRTNLAQGLNLNIGYGYTYATFKDYVIRQKQEDGSLTEQTNYNGRYVPFVPKHTLNIGGEYAITCNQRALIDRIVFQANYNAAGRIYWTEENNVSQAFYGTLNWRVNLEIGKSIVSFWTRNVLDKDYTAFYFETLSRGFRQKGRPSQFGIDLRCRF